MYIILSYNTPEDVSIVTNDDGTPMLFNSKEDASDYAFVNMAFNWTVVEL